MNSLSECVYLMSLLPTSANDDVESFCLATAVFLESLAQERDLHNASQVSSFL